MLSKGCLMKMFHGSHSVKDRWEMQKLMVKYTKTNNAISPQVVRDYMEYMEQIFHIPTSG